MRTFVSCVGLLVLAACSQKSPVGFALPPGDAARGKEAFVAIGCNACHKVQGEELPPPTVQPPVPMLGGKRPHVPTDGELVTSIINPDHDIKRSFVIPTTMDGHSRMPDFKSQMTVQQLVDVVAFLRPKFTHGVGP